MKNSKVKSVIGIIVMSVFFIASSTNNAQAQSPNHNPRNNRQVVKTQRNVKSINNKRATVRNGRIVAVPQNARVVRHNNIDYRFHNGNYYRPANGGFVMANAPIGARVTVLPNGCRQVKKRGVVYYRSGGTYYRPINQPRGGIVYEIVQF